MRFHETEEPTRQGLHICAECNSELVQPVAWAECREDQWELSLQCPNCGWSADGVFNRDEVDQLEEKLDEGLADMLRDLQRLTQANMAEEIDRFVAALHGDYILPEDF